MNEFNAHIFWFIDDIFLDRSLNSKDWVSKFCKLLSRKPYKVDIWIQLRSSDMEFNEMLKLSQLGLSEVFIGVESGSKHALKRLNKHVSKGQNEKALQMLKQLDINITYGFIMFDPGTTLQEVRENLSFMHKYLFFTFNSLFSKLSAYSGTKEREVLLASGNLVMKDWSDVGEWDFEDECVTKFFKLSSSLIKENLEPLELQKDLLLKNYFADSNDKLIAVGKEFERKLANFTLELMTELATILETKRLNEIEIQIFRKQTIHVKNILQKSLMAFDT